MATRHDFTPFICLKDRLKDTPLPLRSKAGEVMAFRPMTTWADNNTSIPYYPLRTLFTNILVSGPFNTAFP